jgi:hypothetical protein
MTVEKLFTQSDVVGIFRGFREGGLEFHADLVLPYRNEFQRIPMHGQHILVQLENPDECVMGRITSFSSLGKLASGGGEEFNIRAVSEERAIPEDLREQYLRYAVNIRVLGVLRLSDGKVQFVPSHRRLPHVGSPVAFPSGEILKEIAGHHLEGASIGLYSLGEYVFAKGSDYESQLEDWIQTSEPTVEVKFPVTNLVARRTFIFARAGFGKSNLNKLLFSKLYESTPHITKRGGREAPVGTLIFDPDGEYFWPDDNGRPGLADVPHLEDKLVVFTPRQNPSPFYQSFVAGGVKLDLRRLRPSDVLSIALGPERQDQQNVRKLKGLSTDAWAKLVDLIDKDGNQADLHHVHNLLGLEQGQDVEALAARANMTTVVRTLHDKRSQFMDLLLSSLRAGKICVVDVSQMRSGQSLILSGLILQKIFDNNQLEFTNAEPKTIPTIAVIEEAQAVLNDRGPGADPYIAWVKEGRKYDLGALMVTQQPGSIPTEILSQGDNWFVFHLLSGADLNNVRNANAHFSSDLLAALLNEPIPGHGVFWSSVGGKPYPISMRAHSFEHAYPILDPDYSKPAATTYASSLREEVIREFAEAGIPTSDENTTDSETNPSDEPQSATELAAPGVDVKAAYEAKAIAALKEEDDLLGRIKGDGAPYGEVKALLLAEFPERIEDRDSLAYNLVPRALSEIFGEQDEAWHSFRPEDRPSTWVKTGEKEDG